MLQYYSCMCHPPHAEKNWTNTVPSFDCPYSSGEGGWGGVIMFGCMPWFSNRSPCILVVVVVVVVGQCFVRISEFYLFCDDWPESLPLPSVLLSLKGVGLGLGVGGTGADQLAAARTAAMVAAAEINANIATGGVAAAVPVASSLVSSCCGS